MSLDKILKDGVDPQIIAAVVQKETGYKTKAEIAGCPGPGISVTIPKDVPTAEADRLINEILAAQEPWQNITLLNEEIASIDDEFAQEIQQGARLVEHGVGSSVIRVQEGGPCSVLRWVE